MSGLTRTRLMIAALLAVALWLVIGPEVLRPRVKPMPPSDVQVQ